MHTFSKKEISNWLLLDYSAQKQVLQERIDLLRNKHVIDFDSFEKRVNDATEESFSDWDDYIEWQANRKFLQELSTKIEDIQHGDFQMA